MQTVKFPEPGHESAHAAHHEILPKTGLATAISHHGELLQGVFLDADQRLVRGLVTLPRLGLGARARFAPQVHGEVTVSPAWKIKARSAALQTLAALGKPGWGGELSLSDGIPPGYGLGSSTSDVVATIRAVCDAFGQRLSARRIAKLSVLAETASDPIMFTDRTVLFAQREGYVIEDLGPPLPELEILGFNTDGERRGVSTLEFEPPRYSWREVQGFRPLLGLLRAAARTADVGFVGRVATSSARINQRYLPKPHFDSVEALAERCGAAGVQAAHSGTVLGLIFDPHASALEERVIEATGHLQALGIREIWRFRSGGI